MTYQHCLQTNTDHTLDCRQGEDKQEHMDGNMQYNYCMTRSSLGNILNRLSSHNCRLVDHDTANWDLKIRTKCYGCKGVEGNIKTIVEYCEKYAESFAFVVRCFQSQ